MFAKTVNKAVDRHAADLVDAINGSARNVRTYACCSGHIVKPGVPYVAFSGTDWGFVRSLLVQVTSVNAATGGSTRLELFESHRRTFRGAMRLTIYPWIELYEDEWKRAFVKHTAPPPPRLVRLWWSELSELARMIDKSEATPSAEFSLHFRRARSRLGEPADN